MEDLYTYEKDLIKQDIVQIIVAKILSAIFIALNNSIAKIIINEKFNETNESCYI